MGVIPPALPSQLHDIVTGLALASLLLWLIRWLGRFVVLGMMPWLAGWVGCRVARRLACELDGSVAAVVLVVVSTSLLSELVRRALLSLYTGPRRSLFLFQPMPRTVKRIWGPR